MLLTYACNCECDYCFLYCGPRARCTFTLAQVHDDLVAPKRVRVDSFDDVHVCQDVSVGNLWETPLSQRLSCGG